MKISLDNDSQTESMVVSCLDIYGKSQNLLCLTSGSMDPTTGGKRSGIQVNMDLDKIMTSTLPKTEEEQFLLIDRDGNIVYEQGMQEMYRVGFLFLEIGLLVAIIVLLLALLMSNLVYNPIGEMVRTATAYRFIYGMGAVVTEGEMAQRALNGEQTPSSEELIQRLRQSDRTGFSADRLASYFTTSFKKKYGMTPGQFRRSQH